MAENDGDDLFNPRRVGRIIQWPEGFAMTLDYTNAGHSVRCCSGHDSLEDAKAHGLLRLIARATATAGGDIDFWRAEAAS